MAFLCFKKNPIVRFFFIVWLLRIDISPSKGLNVNSSSLRPGSGMQSRNMVRQLYLLLYLFYQAELFPDNKTWRPALP